MAAATIDVVIAGQPKSGTTALAAFLGQHPDVCVSVPKEPAYFARDLAAESDTFHGTQRWFEYRTPDQYEALFAAQHEGQIRLDASTAYTWSREAADNIHQANPTARIIIMLREPVAFMHSLHMQYVNETTEDEPDFARALELEGERRQGRSLPSRVRCPSFLHYRERARYTPQVKRFLDRFGNDQVMILISEQFRADNAGEYARVVDFLGLDSSHRPDFQQVHASAAPRSRRVNQLLNTPALKSAAFRVLGPERYTRVSKGAANVVMRPAAREPLNDHLVASLREELRDDVRELSRLLDIDLSRVWGY